MPPTLLRQRINRDDVQRRRVVGSEPTDIAAITAASRVAQGLPAKVMDIDALRAVANVMAVVAGREVARTPVS